MEVPFIYCIITAIAIIVALALLFRLASIGSSIVVGLLKVGPYLAILMSVVSVFLFIMEDARDKLGLGNFFGIIGVTTVAMILIGHAISITRRCILEPKEAPAKKKKESKVRLGSTSLVTLCLLDSVSMIMGGVALGANFILNAGTGFIVAVTLFFYVALQRLISIDRLKEKTTENYANANLFISLCVLLASSIISYFVIKQAYLAAYAAVAVAAGYLIYLALWQFYFLAKSAKK